MICLEAGAFGLAGGAELPDERLSACGVFGPDGAVAGVMRRLRAAGGVTHPDQRPVAGGGAGQLEAECPGGVGEPAVVRRAEVEDLGAFGQQIEHIAVVALDLRRRGRRGGELLVDAGEELGQAAGARPGGQNALLVVSELLQDELEIALALVLVDLGQQRAPPGRDA